MMLCDFIKKVMGGVAGGGTITLLTSPRIGEIKSYHCRFYNDKVYYDSTLESRNMPPSYIDDNNIEIDKPLETHQTDYIFSSDDIILFHTFL